VSVSNTGAITRSYLGLLAALAAANFVGYGARQGLTQSYDTLRATWAASDSELGLVTAAFMVGQAIVTMAMAAAGDRLPRRKFLVAGLAVAAVASAIGAWSVNLPMLITSRVVAGMGTAVIVPVGNSVLGQVFEGESKASRIAVFNLGMFFGGAAGLVGGKTPGFPSVLLVIALPTAVLSLLAVRLPIPREVAIIDAGAPMSWWQRVVAIFQKSVRLISNVLRRPAMAWLLASATAMAFAAGGVAAWLLEFLQREKGMDHDAAQSLLLVSMVGAIAGVVAGGRIGDQWQRRHRAGRARTIATGMSLTTPLLALCVVVPAGPGLYVVAVATMFVLMWYHAPLAATVDDLAPGPLSVSAQAVVIFVMHLCGTAPGSWAIGALSASTGLATAMWLPVVAVAIAAVLMWQCARRVVARGSDSLQTGL
jgi:MFS transporter, Spinster family, sphingosine-1-phosphate transporter